MNKRLSRAEKCALFTELAQECDTVEEFKYKHYHHYKNIITNYTDIRKSLFFHMSEGNPKYDALYIVYMYTFPDNAIYYGITCRPHVRHNGHLRANGDSQVSKYIKLHGMIPIKTVLHENIFATEAVLIERELIANGKNQGWHILNIDAGGSIGGQKGKWTMDKLTAVFLAYNTITDLQRGNSAAYSAAQGRGLLSVLTTHMQRLSNPVTLERCAQSVTTFGSYTDWVKDCGSEYNFIRTQYEDPRDFYYLHNPLSSANSIPKTFKSGFFRQNIERMGDSLSIRVWLNAQDIYTAWVRHHQCGSKTLSKYVGFGDKSTFLSLIKHFKKGWVPSTDSIWSDWSTYMHQDSINWKEGGGDEPEAYLRLTLPYVLAHVLETCKKYKTKPEWKDAEVGQYFCVIKHDWHEHVDAILSSSRKYWTDEEVISVCQSCKTLIEVSQKDPRVYQKLFRSKDLRDKATAHMVNGGLF